MRRHEAVEDLRMRFHPVALTLLINVVACNPGLFGPSCNTFLVTPSAATLHVGDSLSLVVERQGVDVESARCSTVADSPTAYVWTSSAPQIAPVDSLAVVRALAVGEATITAEGRAGGVGAGQRGSAAVRITP